ncbi:MAG: DUF6434 domain-containing protein [Chloroflexota bacterium]
MAEEQRPAIEIIKTGDEFKRWYWLKEELVAYCREHKIPYSAGKFELIERIAYHMDTGEIPKPKRKKVTSKFDWHSETLTLETVITDSYKNTQNMRRFMQAQVGDGFTFKTPFMRWMKANTGKTLQDAVDYWHHFQEEQQADDFQSDIAHHNQFNQYYRDFFEDNPDLTTKEARRCWEYKRSLPMEDGRHRYEKSDLVALDDME